MANGEWDAAAHIRDDKGRFVSSGTIWYVDETISDHLREHEAHNRAHDQQHQAEQKAIDLAAGTVKQWKEDANEWRQTFTDRDRAYAKVGEVEGLDTRLHLIESANIRQEQSEKDRVEREGRDKADSERRQARQLQLVSIVLGIPAVFGAVLGLIALLRPAVPS